MPVNGTEPDRAALEQQMLEAVDRESQQIITDARTKIREVLIQARHDLLTLRAQLTAAHEHVRGADPRARHLVREVAGSLRPEIQAADLEAGALHAALLEYRDEAAAQPLPPASETRLQLSAPVHDVDVDESHVEPARTPRRRTRWLAPTLAVAVVTLLTIAIASWWGRPSIKTGQSSPRAAAPSSTRAPRSLAPAPRVASVAATKTAPSTPGVRVSLEARQPVWVRIRVDGSEDSGRIFSAGERRDVRGQRVSIRAGNGGALAISVNGGGFETFGRGGLPLTRDFGGSQSPAPVQSQAAPATAAAARVPEVPTTKHQGPATPMPSAISNAAPATPSPAVTQVPSNAAAPAATSPPSVTTSSPSVTSTPPTPPTSAAAAAAPSASPEVEVVRAAETWLMAYFRGDRAAMAQSGGSGAVIDDERQAADRPPAGIDMNRTIEQVRVQVVGASALYTARLIETPRGGGNAYRSLISEVWVRSGNAWQILSSRVMPESKVRDLAR